MAKWNNANTKLPHCNAHIESDYLLCIDFDAYGDVPFVAWFNCKKEQWFPAHPSTSFEPVSVTHWQELPEMPT